MSGGGAAGRELSGFMPRTIEFPGGTDIAYAGVPGDAVFAAWEENVPVTAIAVEFSEEYGRGFWR